MKIVNIGIFPQIEISGDIRTYLIYKNIIAFILPFCQGLNLRNSFIQNGYRGFYEQGKLLLREL